MFATRLRSDICQSIFSSNLFNRGNFGYNGEKRLIKEIEERKETKYLVLKDGYKMNWQTPNNIINYVKKNKNKIGGIGNFDIYE